MNEITWSLKTFQIDELTDYAKNPRSLTKQQFEQLKKSLDKFGLIDKPIINADEKNTVIAPMVRLRAQPGMSGTFIRFANAGEEFDLTGETAKESGLPWREVWIKAWIAERDADGQLIALVET